MGQLLVLRVLRLLKLARAVRLLVAFKTLWMLVRGLLSSAGTMFYTFLLMTLILYVAGIMALELITKQRHKFEDSEEALYLIDRHFPELGLTMVSFSFLFLRVE